MISDYFLIWLLFSLDNDEPLPSGTGEVSKECSSFELEGWAEVLQRWRQNLKQRPKQLSPLVRRGIPEALRGEVWQLLSGCIDDRQIIETYKNLISKVNWEKVLFSSLFSSCIAVNAEYLKD